MRRNQPIVIVEFITIPDSPNCVGFTFETTDGINLSAQQIVDALADYLLIHSPDDLLKRRKELMQ
jgi:hypothetical protein